MYTKKNSRIVETTVSQKQKQKVIFFDVIVTKPIDIVFVKMIDKIKEVNQIYVTLQSYEYINATKRIDDDFPLSLTTKKPEVAVAA